MAKPVWGEALQEVMFDLSSEYGAARVRIDSDYMSAYHDGKGGNAGIAREIASWAEAFQARWEALPENHPDRENYYEVIDDYFVDCLSKDMANHLAFSVDRCKEIVRHRMFAR